MGSRTICTLSALAIAHLTSCTSDSPAAGPTPETQVQSDASAADVSIGMPNMPMPGSEASANPPVEASTSSDARTSDVQSDASSTADVSSTPLWPEIDGAWWQIAGNPDLGALNQAGQQPVDFAIWPSADGRWHVWSCIRGTKCGGMTRLFYQWESASPTDTNWTPMGIAMQADTTAGETQCGLQAPFVFQAEGAYQMFYGDWEHICRATSADGRTFTRVLDANNHSALFTEGGGANTRDPMVIKVGNTYHAYYTAFPGNVGSVFVRTATDLKTWSASQIVSQGGMAGKGPLDAECPFVVARPDLGVYYLFRTQHYAPPPAQTTVYRSPDPMDFGVNDDKYRLGTLPVAAPEIFQYNGQWYIAAVRPNLDGLQIAKLKWVAH
jgi:hypothetical protein